MKGERPRRSNVFVSATVECDSGTVVVRLRNFSESGAMIDGESLPPEGARLVLIKDGLVLPASVVWVAGHRRGIAFEEKLPPEALLPTTKGAGKASAAPLPVETRPGLKSRPLTQADRALAERLGVKF